jgi:hypothetical protein
MNAVRAQQPERGPSGAPVDLPEGRYGKAASRHADRRLRIVGSVLGVALLVAVGWAGYAYIAGQKISAEVITFEAVSDRAVQVHLEVHKDPATHGYCTLRSRSGDGAEVGRADFRFDQHAGQVDKVITLRTTSRGSSAELVGCHAD